MDVSRPFFALACQELARRSITSTVIDHLSTRFQNNSDIGIAYVYCNFRRHQEQKPADVLMSLLRQLVQEQPHMPEDIKSLYNSHKVKRTRPSMDKISKALNSVVAMCSRTFIIVDALDELQLPDGGRRILVSELFNIQAKTGASLFATSRFIPEIIKDFEGSVLSEIRANDEDVQTYVGGHLPLLPICVLRSPALQEKIKAEIISAVDGMYMLSNTTRGGKSG